jgi:hypothetical protein
VALHVRCRSVPSGRKADRRVGAAVAAVGFTRALRPHCATDHEASSKRDIADDMAIVNHLTVGRPVLMWLV